MTAPGGKEPPITFNKSERNDAPQRGGWRRLFNYLGPAYLISVGYMDPGNWATDLEAGSSFGYRLLWVLLASNLMALLLQGISSRLGLAGKKNLAQASKELYPGWTNYMLFALAQLAIIACDLAEVIGMAIGLKLLFGLPLMYGVLITLLDTFLLMYLFKKGMRTMELFIVSMVFLIGVSFLAEMFIAQPPAEKVFAGLLPRGFTSNHMLYIAISIIGATVMPHNLYLHSQLVQAPRPGRQATGIRQALRLNRIDTAVALNLAFLVNAAILILAGTAFYNGKGQGVADIEEAHTLLSSLFGKIAPTLFAVALVAAGQSSTVTGTLAGQIVMEGHLKMKLKPWLSRLLTRGLAIIPAAAAIYFFGDGGLNRLLVFSQVVLSLQLGFAIIPLLHFAGNRRLMNGHPTPGLWQVAGWMVAALVIALNTKLVYDFTAGYLENANVAGYAATLLFGGTALCLLLYITLKPWLTRAV